MASRVIPFPARVLRRTAACVLAGSLLALQAGSAGGATPVRFNRDIRPVLATNCYHCHGPDRKNRKARLRLDEEEGIRRAFVPGKLDESKAWIRINAEDLDDRMPPPESHRELTREEIARIGRWITEGVHWEGHWSFTPPSRPDVPAVSDTSWVRNPIDAFVLARLEREGIAPSPEAPREFLLRRASLDLTGLPPSIDEIDAFLADDRPDAYERAIDRLLASPHHGERMALAWMDAARYGDTSVFHADGPRDMWPWRDWVIRAYNENKPFDVFTVEQLAGDLLPGATVEQKIATGFHRNNATTDEGGAIPEEFRVEYAVDRVKTTSLVWMALSMECAQCHDHKYEPISQHDYYRFFAYFNQAADPGMQSRQGNQAPVAGVPNYVLRKKIPALEDELAGLEAALRERAAHASREFEEWLAVAEEDRDTVSVLPEGVIAHFALDESDGLTTRDGASGGEAHVRGKAAWAEGRIDGAFRSGGESFIDCGGTGDFDRSDAFSFGAWIRPDGKPSGAPIARMDEGNRHRGYDIHLAEGRIEVHIVHAWPENAIKVSTSEPLASDTWHHIFVTYDGSSRAAGVTVYAGGEARELSVKEDRLKGTIRTEKPLQIGRRHPGSPFGGLVDDVRVYGRELTPEEVAAVAGKDRIGPVLAKSRAERTDEQVETLQLFYLRTRDEEYRRLAGEVARVRSAIATAAEPVSTVMVMEDVMTPRPTYVLARGSYDAPRKDLLVEPALPEFLLPMAPGSPPTRLGLASWLVDPRHPLTARVAANRYWYMLFGTGIVETVEDFGSQGGWPSHPDLLDWLAVEFIESGWDVRGMIRRLVTSSTYRQSSRATPELLERDPQNRLLARGPRFRLQAETIRDSALAASGLLVRTIGGPGVKPYQPPGLWNEVSLSGDVRFVQDHGEKLYRRGLYTYWKRSAPPPSLVIFDAPSREKCVLRRSRTNTPLQALVTLNDPQYIEAARALAERAMEEGGGAPSQWITYAYRLATGTRPPDATLGVLVRGYAEELSVFRQDPGRAERLLAIGESPRNDQLDACEHAAMTVVASTILNLDQTLTRG